MLPVKTYNNVLTEEQCEKIIDQLDACDLTYIEEESTDFKGCVIYEPIVGSDLILSLPEVISEYARSYSVENNVGAIKQEPTQTMIFEANKGHYDYHFDNMNRKFSAILFLNSVKSGGGIKFYLDEGIYNVKPTSGKLVLFDSYTFYETLMPESEDMYTIITWYRPKD